MEALNLANDRQHPYSLAILASHPIQYQAPLFQALAKVLNLHVYFAHRQTPKGQAAAGFGVEFDWDIDLLSGYNHTFLKNTARNPSTDHFFGCDTPEIKTLLKNKKPDAFLVNGWNLKSYWQGILACRRLKIPVLIRSESQLSTPRSVIKKIVKRIFYKKMLQFFDAYLAIGTRSREYFLYYGVDPKFIFCAPYFVDNEFFQRRALAVGPLRAELRKDWGVKDRTILALFVGKFISKKRPIDLVYALSILHKRGINIEGVFVGSGPLENKIQKVARKLSVKIHLVGFKNQTELPAYYKACDFIVLPSIGSETWGLVINEAMACGLPAVVSDVVGCAPDLITEGKTGEIFKVGNVETLAISIERLLSYLGSENMKKAIEDKIKRHSIENTVQAILNAMKFNLKD